MHGNILCMAVLFAAEIQNPGLKGERPEKVTSAALQCIPCILQTLRQVIFPHCPFITSFLN